MLKHIHSIFGIRLTVCSLCACSKESIGKITTQPVDSDIFTSCFTSLNSSEAKSLYVQYCSTHPAYKGSEEEWVNALFDGSLAQSYKTTYNIIFTIATIPPVLSALDSVRNGNETYAFIERGKTYNGIDSIPNFHNIGFDIKSNKSSGFTAKDFKLVSDTISTLNVFGNEHFNIYVQDGTALYATYLAANSQLSNKQFDVFRVEDWTGAYNAFKDVILGSHKSNVNDDEIFTAYKNNVDQRREKVERILGLKLTIPLSDIMIFQWLSTCQPLRITTIGSRILPSY